MRLRNLIKESDFSKESFPQDKKERLRNKLKDMWAVIEHLEKTGEIHRDDKQRMETFKDFIRDMLKDNNKI